MFNLGFTEVVLLAIIALIFIGPKQLPELARTLGRFMNELKRTTSEIGQTISTPTNSVKDQFQKEIGDIKKGIKGDIRSKEEPAQEQAHEDESHQLEFDTQGHAQPSDIENEHKKDS